MSVLVIGAFVADLKMIAISTSARFANENTAPTVRRWLGAAVVGITRSVLIVARSTVVLALIAMRSCATVTKRCTHVMHAIEHGAKSVVNVMFVSRAQKDTAMIALLIDCKKESLIA